MSYDLTAAQPWHLEENTFPTVNETKIAVDNAKQLLWFNSGKRAKHKGFSSTSPFYENATADYFFKCGYDGVSFEEAQKLLKDKIQQTLENDPIIKETVNELTRENTIDHLYVP